MILAFVIAVSASGHMIGSDLLKLIISTCSGVPRDNQGETAASIRMRMRRGWTAVARA
jgi:hypothetical protein